jgi:hypothetical protein
VAETFQWHGKPIADEDAFLEALVAEMNAGGPEGATTDGLLNAVKTAHPDWYQLGTSARELRRAFKSATPVPAVAGATSPAVPAQPARWVTAVAGWVALLAVAVTSAAIVYGYTARPADTAKLPQPTSVTLTQDQLDAIAKGVAASPEVQRSGVTLSADQLETIAKVPVSQGSETHAAEVKALRDDLRKAEARADDLNKLNAELAKASEAKEKNYSAMVKELDAKLQKYADLAPVFTKNTVYTIGDDKQKQFIKTTQPFEGVKFEGVNHSKDEWTTCVTVPKSLSKPFLLVPKNGKLEVMSFEVKEKDPLEWLKDDRIRPAVIEK